VVPAYNEEARIEPFLKQLLAFKKANFFLREIIAVNDGSTDNTLKVLNSFGKSIRIVSYKKNKGKGFAVRQGLLASRTEFVAFMDADGATPVSQIPKMANALEEADLVVGNRKTSASKVIEKQPFSRRLSSAGFNLIVNLLFGLWGFDMLCGFKGMRKNLAKLLSTELISNRWVFDVEILARAKKRKARIQQIPIEWKHVPGSKMALGLTTLKIFLNLLKLRLKL